MATVQKTVHLGNPGDDLQQTIPIQKRIEARVAEAENLIGRINVVIADRNTLARSCNWYESARGRSVDTERGQYKEISRTVTYDKDQNPEASLGELDGRIQNLQAMLTRYKDDEADLKRLCDQYSALSNRHRGP